MPITKRPPAPTLAPPDEDAVERFIQGAPDAKPSPSPAQPPAAASTPKQDADEGEEGSVQITLRIGKDHLARITEVAKRQGIPRASYIKRAIALQLKEDEKS